MTTLNLSCKNLTTLPDNLPHELQRLYCHYNRLTVLPDDLPQGLQTFHCENNQLTALPDNLPHGLQQLCCCNNQLTALPDNLPQGLNEIWCSYNQLSILPDLPTSSFRIKLTNNPLLKKLYPDIFTFAHPYDAKKIATYVNECNKKMRRARMALINPDNILWELYMKRKMHPQNLQPLLDDTDLDVDTFMTAYVDSL